MNATAREWLAKAEGDYHTARRELGAAEAPNFDASCFHAQQCVEKTMKGLLIHHDVVPARTHDLLRLDQLLRKVCERWVCSADDLRFLTRAAATFRYPGESADREDATEALAICTRLRDGLSKLIPEQ